MKLIDAIEEFLIYYSSVRGMSKNSTAAYKNDLLIFLNMPSIKGKNIEEDIKSFLNSIMLGDYIKIDEERFNVCDEHKTLIKSL